MALWDRLKDGIDKVERVASDALDEGKTRLDARKARQTADKAAEALGYAVFRAWEQGRELDAASLDRLARALRDHEQEALRLEQAATSAADWRRRQEAAGRAPDADTPPPPADPTAGGAGESVRDPSAI
jgi:broad specificity phosphatase PhoE